MIHILHGDVRPTLGPLTQRLFSLSSSTWTLMASSGGIWSIGNPSLHGVALLGVWGGQLMASSCKDDAGPRESSAPITIAIESIESDWESLYASPFDPSMTASQSCGHHHLSGSTFSSRSVHLAPSSLSSHSGSVSVICSLGCHALSSSDEEESGQLTIQWAPSLAIGAASVGACGT